VTLQGMDLETVQPVHFGCLVVRKGVIYARVVEGVKPFNTVFKHGIHF